MRNGFHTVPVLFIAYRLTESQVVGALAWLDVDHFECGKFRRWRSRRQKVLRRDCLRLDEHGSQVFGHTAPP